MVDTMALFEEKQLPHPAVAHDHSDGREGLAERSEQ
jgi:hypothetical protein